MHKEFKRSEERREYDKRLRKRESDEVGGDGMKKATEQPEAAGGGKAARGLSPRSGLD